MGCCERTALGEAIRDKMRCEVLCSKGLQDVLGVLAVSCLYGGCSEAKEGLWGSCGVIKKIKGCMLVFYLLFLVRDRFRSFLF